MLEILATRLAMLQLGSWLYAWGLVLACFLVGLARRLWQLSAGLTGVGI
jgi:hypothetical protein